MHNPICRVAAKKQKDNINHKNKKGTSFLGHGSFGRRKEEEA